MNQKAQGAIEYLLLLAAAVVVVAVVISFMIGTIKPVTGGANKQTFDFKCITLDTNDLECGCYQCKANKGGLNDTLAIPKIDMAKSDVCAQYSIAKDNPLLNQGCW